MKKIVFFEKFKKSFPRLLAVFCTFVVFLGSFSIFYPNQKNSGLIASANTVQPENTIYDTFIDLYAYDYMTIRPSDSSSTQLSFIFGCPNFFFDSINNVTFGDGFMFSYPGNTAYNWKRDYYIFDYSYPDINQPLSTGGYISLIGSAVKKLTTLTRGLSGYSGFWVDIYFDSLVIPRQLMDYYYLPTISFLSSSIPNDTNPSNYIQPIQYLMVGEVYSERGFLTGMNYLVDEFSNEPMPVFDPRFFQNYTADVFWLKNVTISYQLEFSTSLYWYLDYDSYGSLPSHSFSENVLTYLEDAKMISYFKETDIVNVDYLGWLSNLLSGFFNAEIMPNFTLGGILGIIIAISTILVLLKYFAGG